ncbi:MAG: hypothetical protein IIA45_04305 [Bacteroidetes bacterium]|nr:hypothetical protein [Bacteroidota bacterium]
MAREIKKVLKEISTYALSALISVFTFGQILKIVTFLSVPCEVKVKEILSFNNRDYDVLYMGNSLMQQGVMPTIMDSILNCKSYNMAIGGASIPTMEMLLRNYLKNNSKPKLIIYNIFVNAKLQNDRIRPTVFDGLSKEVRMEYYSYLSSNKIKKAPYIKSFYFLSSKKYSDWLSVIIRECYLVFKFKNSLLCFFNKLLGGHKYDFNFNSGHLSTKVTCRNMDSHELHHAGNNITALSSLINFCNKQKISIKFVELPNHEAFNKTVLNRNEILKELHQVQDISNNFYTLNYPNKYAGIDWSSKNHLNDRGAIKLSNELAQVMQNEMLGGLAENTINTSSSHEVNNKLQVSDQIRSQPALRNSVQLENSE